MKIAVLSDIHGNLPALEAVLADVAREGVDTVVNLGDIVSGPLQPAATLDLLMTRDFPTIRGNHERQVLALIDAGAFFDPLGSDGYAAGELSAAHVAWLRALPESMVLYGEVRLCHGTPGSDLAYWLETVDASYDAGRSEGACGVRAATAEEVAARLGDAHEPLILCGHTHVPRAVRCGNTLVVNPGSVGLQAYDDVHPLPHVIESGSTGARYALLERSATGWHAELREVAYDHRAQAEIASQRGRPDWAQALATGRALRRV